MKKTQIIEAFRYIGVWALAWAALPWLFWLVFDYQHRLTDLSVWYPKLFCWSILGAVMAYFLAYSQLAPPFIFWPIFWSIVLISQSDFHQTYQGMRVSSETTEACLSLYVLFVIWPSASLVAVLLSSFPLFRHPQFPKTP